MSQRRLRAHRFVKNGPRTSAWDFGWVSAQSRISLPSFLLMEYLFIGKSSQYPKCWSPSRRARFKDEDRFSVWCPVVEIPPIAPPPIVYRMHGLPHATRFLTVICTAPQSANIMDYTYRISMQHRYKALVHRQLCSYQETNQSKTCFFNLIHALQQWNQNLKAVSVNDEK